MKHSLIAFTLTLAAVSSQAVVFEGKTNFRYSDIPYDYTVDEAIDATKKAARIEAEQNCVLANYSVVECKAAKSIESASYTKRAGGFDTYARSILELNAPSCEPVVTAVPAHEVVANQE